MSASYFVDTNVFVYGRDSSEPEKQPRASLWIASLWKSRAGVLSIQVLNEYYYTVTQKLNPGMTREEARSDVASLMSWNPLPIEGRVVQRGWLLQDRFGLSWWDALIVAAAQLSGSKYLLSEDLQDEQNYDGLIVLNPFTHDLP